MSLHEWDHCEIALFIPESCGETGEDALEQHLCDKNDRRPIQPSPASVLTQRLWCLSDASAAASAINILGPPPQLYSILRVKLAIL